MAQQRKDNTSKQQWGILSALTENELIDSEFELRRDTIQLLLEKISQLYIKLIEKEPEEHNRLTTVENAINAVIYERQALGVAIDSGSAKARCAELEREIYSIKNELQISYGIFDPDNEGQQNAYLKFKGYPVIQSFLYSFKIRRKLDRVCALFYELLRNNHDLDSLLYMLAHWGSSQRTYPTYVGFGTITSRITLRQPSLQNLRKKNRSVIVADDGMKLLYIDYCQFEAGILAHLSDDELLIEKCNLDIYADLADKVLKDVSRRDEAKIVFYRYIYGDTTLEKNAIEYFKQFKKLYEYQRKIKDEANTVGKVGTIVGNFRLCYEDNCAWALSHVVQATASLIYKKAVIRVRTEIKDAEFLVPMHDGTLYQLSTWKYEELKAAISAIYIEEYKAICPKIKADVDCSESFT
jgi:DNA polymerase I-like protein with 3'-5' exonuclease and polymerase domains